MTAQSKRAQGAGYVLSPHNNNRRKDSNSTLLRPGSLACLCRACGAVFRGVREFDRHRVGPWSERRCVTTPRMGERGLEYDPRGFWRFPKRKYTGPRAQVIHVAA